MREFGVAVALGEVLVCGAFALVCGREARGAEVGAEEVGFAVFAGRVVGFEDQFVGREGGSEEESVVEDAEDEGGELRGGWGEGEEGSGGKRGEDLDEDLFVDVRSG